MYLKNLTTMFQTIGGTCDRSISTCEMPTRFSLLGKLLALAYESETKNEHFDIGTRCFSLFEHFVSHFVCEIKKQAVFGLSDLVLEGKLAQGLRVEIAWKVRTHIAVPSQKSLSDFLLRNLQSLSIPFRIRC